MRQRPSPLAALRWTTLSLLLAGAVAAATPSAPGAAANPRSSGEQATRCALFFSLVALNPDLAEYKDTLTSIVRGLIDYTASARVTQAQQQAWAEAYRQEVDAAVRREDTAFAEGETRTCTRFARHPPPLLAQDGIPPVPLEPLPVEAIEFLDLSIAHWDAKDAAAGRVEGDVDDN